MSENQEQPLFDKKDEGAKEEKGAAKKSKAGLIGAIVGGVVLVGGIVLLIVLLTRPDKLVCTLKDDYSDAEVTVVFGGENGLSKVIHTSFDENEFDDEDEARENFDDYRDMMRSAVEENDDEDEDVRIKVDNDREFTIEGTSKDGSNTTMKMVLSGKVIKSEMTITMSGGEALDEAIEDLKSDFERKEIEGGITKENVKKSLEDDDYICK